MNICKPESDTTLILTKSWQPFGITSAREAIRKLMSSEGKKNQSLRALDADGNSHSFSSWIMCDRYFDSQPFLRSATKPFPVPTILITNSFFFYRPRIRRVTIKMLYTHFKGICQICGKRKHIDEMTREHIKPLSKGGSNENENISLTCKTCNAKKDSIFPYLTNDGKELKGFTAEFHELRLVREEWKLFVKK
jgi:hypothetical protein